MKCPNCSNPINPVAWYTEDGASGWLCKECRINLPVSLVEKTEEEEPKKLKDAIKDETSTSLEELINNILNELAGIKVELDNLKNLKKTVELYLVKEKTGRGQKRTRKSE